MEEEADDRTLITLRTLGNARTGTIALVFFKFTVMSVNIQPPFECIPHSKNWQWTKFTVSRLKRPVGVLVVATYDTVLS